MAESGVTVDPEAITVYEYMKMYHTNKFATFKIENKEKVVVDIKGDQKLTKTKEEDKACFQGMMNHCQSEPRYIVYELGFTSSTGEKIEKLAFIVWNPDDGAIKEKMLYSRTKDSVMKSFTGIGATFQADNRNDLSYDDYSEEIERRA